MKSLTELLERREPTIFTLGEIAPFLQSHGVNVFELPRLSDRWIRDYRVEFSNIVVKPYKTEDGVKTQIEGEYRLQAVAGNYDKTKGIWLPGEPRRYRFATLDGKIKSTEKV